MLVFPQTKSPSSGWSQFPALPIWGLLALLSVCVNSVAENDGELVGLPPDSLPGASNKPDFSGAWEKDYRRSDDWEERVKQKISELRREAERQARSVGDRRPRRNTVQIGVPVGNRKTNIIDLARFTELISRYNDLFITQDGNQIRIKREGEADLICGLDNQISTSSSNQYGIERCGWDNDQLLFRIDLPGDIGVLHRFAISPEGFSINVHTRVSSGNSQAFDLFQYFNRYEAPVEQYQCRQTLSRGKVCHQNVKESDP